MAVTTSAELTLRVLAVNTGGGGWWGLPRVSTPYRSDSFRVTCHWPSFVPRRSRYGRPDPRQRLKQISAATIDRLLRDVREQAFSGQGRRAGGIGNAIRRAVPIRTFTDWNAAIQAPHRDGSHLVFRRSTAHSAAPSESVAIESGKDIGDPDPWWRRRRSGEGGRCCAPRQPSLENDSSVTTIRE